MGSSTGAFPIATAVVMILVSLTTGWGAPGTDSTVVRAGGVVNVNSTPGTIDKPQNATDISPDGAQLPDEVSDMSSLEDSRRQQVRPLSEYVRGAPARRGELDLIGIEVDDGMDRFEGQHVFGAEVINVRPSSPAALAGLESRRAAINVLLQLVTVAGAVAFPPVAVAFMAVSATGVGDWHDLIIGVDGERVQDVSDLENALGRVKEGDTVYLTLVRSGKRVQVPVSLQSLGSK